MAIFQAAGRPVTPMGGLKQLPHFTTPLARNARDQSKCPARMIHLPS
jgi:hypothetical protein